MSLPPFKLNNGLSIPALGYGLGTANFKSAPGDLDEATVNATVTAIKTGILHLDGAEVYGNEEELGKAIRNSGLPRSQFYVTTKLFAEDPAPAEQFLRKSLQKLGLDYVDLYLIHQPFAANDDPKILQTRWAELEALHDAGLTRSIGVSNYLQSHLEPVLATARIPPAVNQIEFHPHLQHGNLLEFHRKHGILTQAYAPLTPLTHEIPGGNAVKLIWQRLAGKYNVSDSAIGLRWVLDQGVLPITTSKRKERLESLLEDLPRFKLTENEISEINKAGETVHYRVWWRNKIANDDHR
ncbi:NAD/NADP-dependent indole-3-acetaldehyde reductase [Ceratocystis lukuohia]|uniref:NAD/NADP-dependent indole-3-acetaldehyde reductase n=1 Tax=Ceratocystis lukuohia TaxID=2019550 RepID=A0ABR4MPM2_9PEZI